MALKRKRSDSDISTSSSILSSSPSAQAVEMSSSSSSASRFSRDITACHLSSRTRKRFRDNRPSEAEIHENTLSKLYSARRNAQATSPQSQVVLAISVPINHLQQTSLHSFWALPSQPSSSSSSDASSSPPPPATKYEATNCEDCDISLISADGDAMDIDMDVDIPQSSADYACSSCSKQICYHSAISNLGKQRRCLICAGKRTWVGGIGWMDQD